MAVHLNSDSFLVYLKVTKDERFSRRHLISEKIGVAERPYAHSRQQTGDLALAPMWRCQVFLIEPLV